MSASTAAGSKWGISAASPATMNLAGAAALTYTFVGKLEQIGTFGATDEVVNFQPLDGPLEKYKGPSNSGALSPQFAHDDDDAGQTLVRTAAEDKSSKLYWACIVLPNGAKRYAGGRIFGYPETIGAANSMIMAAPSFEISTAIFKAPPA